MSRETRLIVVMLVFAVAGIGALSFVAGQYRKRSVAMTAPQVDVSARTGALRPDAPASARAAREVEGFLAARLAAQKVCARYGDRMKAVAGAVSGTFDGVEGRRVGYGLDVIAAYRVERMDAFTAHGMDHAEYAAVRDAWRAWRAASPGADAALTAAFEARRADAEEAGLGEFESFDDAVK